MSIVIIILLVTAVSAVFKNDVYILNNYDNKYDKYDEGRDNIFKIHHFIQCNSTSPKDVILVCAEMVCISLVILLSVR